MKNTRDHFFLILEQTLQPSDSEALINNDSDGPFTPTPSGHYLAPASTPGFPNSTGGVKCATELIRADSFAENGVTEPLPPATPIMDALGSCNAVSPYWATN